MNLDKITKDIGTVVSDEKYSLVLASTAVISFILFFALTVLFPFSYFLVENYVKTNFTLVFQVISMMILFSLLLGLITAFIYLRFKSVVEKKLYWFIGLIQLFFIAFLMLSLVNTSFNLFSFTEMNSFVLTFIGMILLASIIPLSVLMILNIYTMYKEASAGSASGGAGFIATIFSLGCPTCGALLYSLIGVTAGLSIFPFAGLEVRAGSLVLLVFSANELQKTKACKARLTVSHSARKPFFNNRFEKIMLIVFLLLIVISLFNQMQIMAVSNSINPLKPPTKITFNPVQSDLTKIDVTHVDSTAKAIGTVFPELMTAKDETEVISILLPSGTPEYSSSIGGITFDDPINSLSYLSVWYYTLKDEVKQNNPEVWQRYLNLAAAPRGISCEFCCGVNAQGITAEGDLMCKCQHNPALHAITLGLMRDSDYSDAEVLREVLRWKTIWFPRDMISLGIQVSGKNPDEISSLPGMVGGC